MKLGRVLVALCLGAACASFARAQDEGGRRSAPASVGESAPARILESRAGRSAVVRLKSGESVACNFLRADGERVEVEAAGERREFSMDAVASIVFSPGAAAGEGKASAQAPLVVSARLCETYDRFTALSGEVRNASPRRIGNLVAVGTFRGKGGAVLKVEQQLVGDVAAGETAAFKVMWWYDPRIESCTVSFKIFGGKPLPHAEALEQ